MKIFKIDAQGDTVYVQAKDEAEARNKLTKAMGPIPSGLLTFTIVPALPDGEEFL